MGTVLTVANTKGGVGKSTVTRYVAGELAAKGNKVCIIDLCENSSIATSFLKNRDSYTTTVYDWLTDDAKASEVVQVVSDNLHFIPSDERVDDFVEYVDKEIFMTEQHTSILRKVKPLKGFYDYVLIDTHPSENSKLGHYAMIASDYIVIPYEIDKDSRIGVKRTVEIVEKFIEVEMIKDYFIVPNKVDANSIHNKTYLNKYVYQPLIDMNVNTEKCTPIVRSSRVVSRSKDEGVSLYTKQEASKYARSVIDDFRKVTEHILEKLKGEKVNE